MTNYHSDTLLGLIGSTEAEQRKFVAWKNARPIENSSDRIDCDGRMIRWDDYGEQTAYGWEIDHATPTALGGRDVYDNLRARHWHGNRSAGGILGALSRSENPVGLLGRLFDVGNSR